MAFNINIYQHMNIIAIAVLTGFFGDLLLQLGTQKLHLGGPSGWGLIPYFKQHGPGS
jgi:hypothetical protein